MLEKKTPTMTQLVVGGMYLTINQYAHNNSTAINMPTVLYSPEWNCLINCKKLIRKN